jgi:hypothetical protein
MNGPEDAKLHVVIIKTPDLDYRLPVTLDADDREKLGRALETSQRLGHIESWEISPAPPMDRRSLVDWLDREGFFDSGDRIDPPAGFLPPSDWEPEF